MKQESCKPLISDSAQDWRNLHCKKRSGVIAFLLFSGDAGMLEPAFFEC